MPAVDDWNRERQVAEAAVHEAAKLTKRVLSTVKEIAKGDSSPVTAADFASQALLISILRDAFPGDGFVGEEGAELLGQNKALKERVYDLFSSACVRSDDGDCPSMEEMLKLIDLGGSDCGACSEDGGSGRFWVMDPVDGTAAFLRGEQYAVSLALVQDGQEVVGVLACPNLKLRDGRVCESSVDSDGLGIMLSAVKGRGASIIPLPLPESPLSRHPLSRLEAPSSLADVHIVDCALNSPSRRSVVQQLAARLHTSFPGTDIWSSHIRYAALVLGGGHLLVRVPSKSKSCLWDHAGSQLIYTELGGTVTDFDGKPVDFLAGKYLTRNRGLVVAHSDIQAKILSLVQELVPEEQPASPEEDTKSM